MSKAPDPTPDLRDDNPADPVIDRSRPAKETGGPKEADPTRYGDWTVKGRCIDF